MVMSAKDFCVTSAIDVVISVKVAVMSKIGVLMSLISVFLKVKETSCALHLRQHLLRSLKFPDFLSVADLYNFNIMLL